MQYSRLGNTGLIVSRLAFGTMTFGNDPSMPNIYKVDKKLAETLIKKSIDAGINFFDTADMYSNGQSEVMTGELLGKHRHDVIIATKVGFRSGETITNAGLSRLHILNGCDASLKRLNTDYIDLYIVHKVDQYTPIEETLEALNDLVRAGKVRYIGFSNWSAWRAATALQMQKANGWAKFTSGQMYYSLLGRDVEHDVVPFAKYAGLSLTVWSPLAGGFLSGKYTRENLKEGNNRMAGFDFIPFDKERGFQLVERIREIAKKYNASVAQIALAWLLAKPVVATIIVGASKPEQLDDNLKTVDVNLSPADIEELDTLTAPDVIYPNWFINNLTDEKHKNALGPA